MSTLKATNFNMLNQGVYSSTFLAYDRKGLFCQGCLMSDHNREECAMHPKQAMTMVHVREAVGSRSKENSCLPRGQEHKTPMRGVCFAWNDGKCQVYLSKFSQVCSRCGVYEHKRPLFNARSGESHIKWERMDPKIQIVTVLEQCSLGCEWLWTVHETLFVGPYYTSYEVSSGRVTLALLLGWKNIGFSV